jgi:outer membrane protein TolC
MNMIRISKSMLFSMLFMAATARAQEVKLTLEEALNAALANNKEINMARMDEETARARFRQTQATFLPQVSLSYAAMSSNNPLNAFGFKLQQQSITASDFNPELLNSPSATQNFMSKAEWKQPILNMDILQARQGAREQVNAVEFQSQRTRQYLSLEVEKAYAQLQLAHQAKRVTEETLDMMKAVLRSTTHRYEKGYLQKSDLLQVEVQVASAESAVAESKSNVRNASDYLSLLMGSNTNTTYSVDSINYVDSYDVTDSTVPQNRADFLAMQSVVNAHERMMQSHKMAYVPRVNAFGEYLINDADAFGFGSDSYLVGAQLSWTIFNGMATRSRIEEQRIERNKTAELLAYRQEQAQVELNKMLRQRDDARLDIAKQNTSVSQATEAFRIMENRYRQGLVSTNDLLHAQTLLSQQKLNRAQAVYRFNTTGAHIKFLTSTSEK